MPLWLGCAVERQEFGVAAVRRGVLSGIVFDYEPAHAVGSAVASADVNGDGYDDLIVGAPSYESGTEGGRVEVFYGSADGVGDEPDWTDSIGQPGALFGVVVNAAGDVNGDGYDDVIVGARQYTDGEMHEGAALVYHGSATGLADAPDWLVEGGVPGMLMGRAVAGAGDINGDGYDDVIVGAYEPVDRGGQVFVYLGSGDGLATAFHWNDVSHTDFAQYGSAVGTAGDTNGDGYDDIVVGAPGWTSVWDKRGFARVYLGAASGEFTLGGSYAGSADYAYIGSAVGCAGDVNGDGYDDVFVGARGFSQDLSLEGAAFVFHGSADGTQFSFPASRALGGQSSAYFGTAVARAGDINDDGYDDLVASAFRYDVAETDEGRVAVYFGSADGVPDEPDWVVEGDTAQAHLGLSLGSGDFDGDGRSEVIIGSADHVRLFAPSCADADSDGMCDSADNCIDVANADQLDSDADGPGDACDACALDAANDADSDGACGDVDNCPATANADQLDTDSDGTGDVCDATPNGDPPDSDPPDSDPPDTDPPDTDPPDTDPPDANANDANTSGCMIGGSSSASHGLLLLALAWATRRRRT